MASSNQTYQGSNLPFRMAQMYFYSKTKNMHGIKIVKYVRVITPSELKFIFCVKKVNYWF